MQAIRIEQRKASRHNATTSGSSESRRATLNAARNGVQETWRERTKEGGGREGGEREEREREGGRKDKGRENKGGREEEGREGGRTKEERENSVIAMKLVHNVPSPITPLPFPLTLFPSLLHSFTP